MDSGVRLAAAGRPWAAGPLAQRTVRYETIVVDTAFKRARRSFFKLWDGLFVHFRAGAAVARSPVSLATERRLQPFDDTITIVDDGFTIASDIDNVVLAGTAEFGSYAEAASHLSTLVRGDPSLAGRLHVIPAVEAGSAA